MIFCTFLHDYMETTDNKRLKIIYDGLIERRIVYNMADFSRKISYSETAVALAMKGKRGFSLQMKHAVEKNFTEVRADFIYEGTGDPFLPEKSTVKTPYLEEQQKNNIVAEDDSPGYEQGKNPSKEEVLQQAMAIIKDLSKRPDEMAKLKEWVERHTWQQGENLRKENTWLKELLELKMAQQADLIARLQKEIDALKKSKV